MDTQSVTISQTDLRKLLSAASPDAALLYLYMKAGNPMEQAESSLKMGASRVNCAAAILRQTGLWQDERKTPVMPGERPQYTETEVSQALSADNSFQSLYAEVQRLLGKALNNEELKILLGFDRYLGLSADVISVLICYCKDRARQQGRLRTPSLRTIEKEAYLWAEMGIDTLEDAAAYIQKQNVRHSRLYRIMEILQIRGRSLTPGENKYAESWLDMGFDDAAIQEAYERTCLNTGGLKWNYMDKILNRWHAAGLHTGEQVASGDRKPDTRSGERQLDADEQAAIARMLREG